MDRFPQQGPISDISILAFKGLGRGRGFEVKERRSALGDEGMKAGIIDRAREILHFLESGWEGPEEHQDVELLKVGVAESERHFEGLTKKLRAAEDKLGAQEDKVTDLEEALRRERARLEDFSSQLAGLLEALGPFLDKAHYIAMEDDSFAEAYQEAVASVEDVRGALEGKSEENG